MTEITKLFESGININVTISINDLIEWHKLVIEDTKQQLENFVRSENAERFLNNKEVCDMFNISDTTLWRWKKEKYLVPITIGGKKKYKLSELKELLNRKIAS